MLKPILHSVVCLTVIFIMLSTLVSQADAQLLLSLDSCHSLAIQHNKELQTTDAAVRAAKAKREEVRMNYFPQINLNAGYLHMGKDVQLIDYDGVFGAASMLIPQHIKEFTNIELSNIWAANASLVQPLFAGGKIVAGNRMASLAIALKQEMRETTRRAVLESVDEAYWQVVQLAAKEKLIKQLQKMFVDTQRDIDLLIAEGVATKADGLSVRVKSSEADLQLTKVQNGLALSRMLLAKRCGLSPDVHIQTADETADSIALHDYPIRSTDESAISTALENRSELRSLRIAEDMYRQKTRVATADMLPSAALVAGYTLSKPSIFQPARDKFGGTYAIGILLRIPITQAISGGFRRTEAKAEETIQTLRRQDAEEMISLEIRQAILTHHEAQKQVSAAHTNKERAEENLRYARIGYNEGVIPIINLTQAQTLWAQALDQYLDAQIVVRLSQTKLDRVLSR